MVLDLAKKVGVYSQSAYRGINCKQLFLNGSCINN